MAKGWYIYVDDIRNMEQDRRDYLWSIGYVPITIRDYVSAIDCLADQLISSQEVYIDLDHDLGESKSGYDICKWIVENQYPLTGFHIHSMNPVGAQNMRELLEHYGYLQV